jgi:hypothetical protein
MLIRARIAPSRCARGSLSEAERRKLRAMNTQPTTLDRALEIASSAKCRTMAQLRHQLVREGFHDHERALFGVSMRLQLQALMARRGAALPAGQDA